MPPTAEMTESSREETARKTTIQRDVGGGENDGAAAAARAARARGVAVFAVRLNVSANDDAGGLQPDAAASVLSRSRAQKKRLLSGGEEGRTHALVEGVSNDLALVGRVGVVVLRVPSSRPSVAGAIDVIALSRSRRIAERRRFDAAFLAKQNVLSGDARCLRLDIAHPTQGYGNARVVIHHNGSQKRKLDGTVLLRAKDGPASLVVAQKMNRSVPCENVRCVCFHLIIHPKPHFYVVVVFGGHFTERIECSIIAELIEALTCDKRDRQHEDEVKDESLSSSTCSHRKTQ